MGKKIFNLIPVLFLFFLLNSNRVEADVFVTTPEFHGQIIDTKTGKPVKNVKVVATWEGTVKTAGNANQIFDGIEVTSDSKGQYKIDKKTSFHLTSDLKNVYIMVEHPGYVPIKKTPVWTWDVTTKSESVAGTRQKDGSVKYDIKLEKAE